MSDDQSGGTTATESFVNLGELSLTSPLVPKYIKEVSVREEVNCHGLAEITLIPTAILSGDDVLKLEAQAITLDTTEGSPVFHGTVLEVRVRKEASYQEITLIGGSNTVDMDFSPKTAFFQKEGKTLSEITALLTGFTVTLSSDLTIPEILFQNKESNFAFVRRIANEYRQLLMVDCKTTGNPVYIGSDPIMVKTMGAFSRPVMKKSVHAIEKLKYTAEATAEAFQFAQEHLTVGDVSVGVGCELQYQDQAMLVVSSHITTEKGILLNRISLVGSGGQSPLGKYASPPIPRGYLLPGEVKAVQDNTVQVEFFSQADTMMWLPYENTINNYCYAMPDVGDLVYVYHHPKDNSKNICLSCLHVNESDDFNTTATKSLTSEDCMIQFEEDALHLTGLRSEMEGNEKDYISLKDSGGIELVSSGRIIFESDGDVVVFAGKSHAGMAAAQTTFLASSSAGYAQLLTGAGIALGVPPVAIPSTVVATSKLAADACIDLPSDLSSTLSGLDETMTEGNSPTNKSEGKITILSEESVKLVVGGTSLEITKNTFNIASSVVLM